MTEQQPNIDLKRKIRINPRGRLIKVTNETYKHEDISCGYSTCESCFTKTNIFDPSNNSLIFISYDTVRNYFDCIFNAQIVNMVISQSTIERLKEKSESIFKRLKNIINLEKWRNIYVFPNEFCVETSVARAENINSDQHYLNSELRLLEFYTHHLKEQKLNIFYVTDDQNLILEAREKHLSTMTIFRFARELFPHQPELKDFIGFSENDFLKILKLAPQLMNNHQVHLASDVAMKGVSNGQLFKGKIKFNRSNVLEARIFSFVLNREIIIRGSENINRSLEGDVVAVELLDEKNWLKNKLLIDLADDVNDVPEIEDEKQKINETEKVLLIKKKLKNLDIVPTGQVVGLIKRDLRNFAGEVIDEFKPNGKEVSFGLVSLSDARISNVLILSNNLSLLAGKKIIVSIDSWPEYSRYPIGRCIKILGKSGETKIENDAILFEFNIETLDFSQKVLDCLPSIADYPELTKSETKKRIDLRDFYICSVDPPGCKDIDDALHCREIDANTWEAGVHIADVSFFVKPNTPLDLEAANRCTTVYLVDRRTDMLPKLLTEQLCSLVGNEERLSFSVFWEFNPKSGEIKKTRFGKSIICSKKAYSYQMAQERIDDKNDTTELTFGLRRLMHLAKILKKNRLENGALQLASTQVKFKMDEDQNPTDVSYYDLKETNSMVEEFMLLANVAVAKKITESYPSLSILRRHTTPKPEMIKQLSKILGGLGYNLDYSSSRSLADSLDRIQRSNDPFFNTLVRIMTTRCMNEATYFCSSDFDQTEFRHYGLAVDYYTHFTSPIRRYADVLVHRLLAATLEIESLPNNMTNSANMTSVSEKMNMRNRNARNASRASSEFFSYLFFKDKVFEEKGIISSLQNNGFSITIVKYGFEAFVEFSENDLVNNSNLESKGINPMIKFFHEGKLLTLFDWVDASMSIKLVNYRKIVTVKIM